MLSELETTRTASDPWAVEMDVPGVLCVRSLRAVLSYDEVRTISERLLAERLDETLSEIVFDFGNVRTIAAPWTPVVAKLMDLARRCQAACRLRALRGQPETVIRSLLNNRAAPGLLLVEDRPPRE